MAVPAGTPRIDFRAHQVRTGAEGARYEFEQMIALLVQRKVGEARRIAVSQGDGGIDVMVGELSDRISIWQAKYYINGVDSSRLSKVKESFDRAREAARGRYRIERWILCVPCDLTREMLPKWELWKREQTARTGITIGLWDATTLTDILLDRRMDDIRRHFYDPYDPDGPALEGDAGGSGARSSIRLRTTTDRTASADPAVWEGGRELLVGGRACLLHDPVETRTATDRSWLLREATADELDGRSRRVRIRQLRVRRSTAASDAIRAGLAEQADLAYRLAGAPGVPERLDWVVSSGQATLVTTLASAPTWRAVHGGGACSADRLAAAAMLGQADDLCRKLTTLHRLGLGHGQLTGETVLLVDGRRHTALRDLGLAGFGPAGVSAATGDARWTSSLPAATPVPSGRGRPRSAWQGGESPGGKWQGAEWSGGEWSSGEPWEGDLRAHDVGRVAALVRQAFAVRPPAGDVPAPFTSPPAMLRPPAILRPPPAPAPSLAGGVPGSEWPDLTDLAVLLERALRPAHAERPTLGELADGLRVARRRLSVGRL